MMTMIPNHKAAAAASVPTGSDVHFKDAVKLLRAKYSRMAAEKEAAGPEPSADMETES
jgi:hypothetical protein